MHNYNKFTLSNGLRVIHLEDKTRTTVVLNTLYNVGARDEDEDQTFRNAAQVVHYVVDLVVLLDPLGRAHEPGFLAVPRRVDDRAPGLPALPAQFAERAQERFRELRAAASLIVSSRAARPSSKASAEAQAVLMF